MEQRYQQKIGRYTTQQIVIMALFLALHVVLGALPTIRTPYVEFGWGFIATGLGAAIVGPVPSMVIGAAADILKFFLFQGGSEFFFGYTFSAILAGLIYSYGLYRRDRQVKQIFLTVLVVTLIVNIGFGTWWIMILRGKAASVILPPRILKNIASLFINTLMLTLLFKNAHIQQLIETYEFPPFRLSK